MALKFSGTFSDLSSKLAALNGQWDESQPNKKILRLHNGVMNWFESTGSINFQGKSPGKATLESKVPTLLYPTEIEAITTSKALVDTLDISSISTESTQDLSIERQYLTTGINDGELVIGIVSAVGTEYKRVTEPLTDRLKGFGYTVEDIRVSSCLPSFSGDSEYDRIKHYMQAGNGLRENSKNNAILAAGVVKSISDSRKTSNPKRAYIINSLKHPREVEFLRKVYGDGFYLIGIHADEKRRHQHLTEDKSMTQIEASELIQIDEDESFNHGQKTRDTYHLSDFFLNLGSNSDQVKHRFESTKVY